MQQKEEWKMLDPASKKIWRVKGIIFFGLFLLLFLVSFILVLVYDTSNTDKNLTLLAFIIVITCILIFFCIYNFWVSMYYNNYRYALGKEGLLINRGIWWKYRRTVPYARIQHISIDQGPVEQIFGLYRVNSYTAGTGSIGGASAASRATGPEGQILGVRMPEPLKEEILRRVMPFRTGDGITDITTGSSGKVVEELQAIRKLLEKKNK
jgi:membrane protein YdbS with pleckstrin-like domain